MENIENLQLRKAILEVINNQMRDNNPPETNQTFARLQKEGFSEEEAFKLIGYVVASEVFTVLKESRSYDKAKYISALNALPKLPWKKEA